MILNYSFLSIAPLIFKLKLWVSHVWLFATTWTVAHQASLLMGVSRQEYWSGLPCPPPGDLPDAEIEPVSPALQADSLEWATREAQINYTSIKKILEREPAVSQLVYFVLHAVNGTSAMRLWLIQFSSVQSLSRVRLFVTPWTAARQASLSITNSWSPPKPMSIVSWCHPTISSSVVPFSSCPQSFPASGSFQMSQHSASGSQSIGVSASTSVPPMNIQDWSPSGWTGWISLQSKEHSRVFSNTTVQKHQFFGTQLLYSPTLTSIHDYWINHSLD